MLMTMPQSRLGTSWTEKSSLSPLSLPGEVPVCAPQPISQCLPNPSTEVSPLLCLPHSRAWI